MSINETTAIDVQKIGKKFTRSTGLTYSTLGDLIMESLFRSKKNKQEFWCLKDVSFSINFGEVVGIIGRNGSGKSTLLKILSGVTVPTEGYADIHGQISAILEVGPGFHPELTGRENIYLSGGILGMSHVDIRKCYDDIVAFAELEDFMDEPVKHYSTGMHARLGLSVAIHLIGEIVIIDEMLTVGDAKFQRKCEERLRKLVSEGRAVIIVSHNMHLINSLCHKVFLLEGGRLFPVRSKSEGIHRYLEEEPQKLKWTGEIGDDNLQFNLAELSSDTTAENVFYRNGKATLTIEYTILKPQDYLVVGFEIFNVQGTRLVVSRLSEYDENSQALKVPGRHRVSIDLDLSIISHGRYQIRFDFGIHNIKRIISYEPTLDFTVLRQEGESTKYETDVIQNIIYPPWEWNTKPVHVLAQPLSDRSLAKD